jgi:intraflagellar transport protein 56
MHPDSATTMNLTACNHFRLFNGKEAENQLNELQKMASPSFEYAQDLIKHNLVVFRNGEQALQVCRQSRTFSFFFFYPDPCPPYP